MYYCVIDFETTCWKKNNIENEIIEFPSILLYYFENNIEIIDKFHRFVRPTLHLELSDFCKKITGITQRLINKSKPLLDVINEHIEWLHKNINDEDVIFITCGDFDFAYQLTNELEMKNMELNNIYKKYINLKDEFSKFYNCKTKGMKHMLEYLGLPLFGSHHSGMDDTINITNIFIQMIQEGCKNLSVIMYE